MMGDLGYQFGYDFDLGILDSNNLIYAKEAIFNGKSIYIREFSETTIRVNSLISMYYYFQEERKVVLDAYRR